MNKGVVIVTGVLVIGLALGGKMVLDERARIQGSPVVFSGGDGEACLSCHSGIEEIHPKAPLRCVSCHRGDPESKDKAIAHAGMLNNPSDLAVAEETCGNCHQTIVDRVKRSLMATRAGTLSAVLYLNGLQDEKETTHFTMSKYPIRALSEAKPLPVGTVSELEAFPTYAETNNLFVDLMRKECMQCHHWTEGVQRRGDFRGTGCAACHMTYDAEGKSRSGDRTIPKDRPGHPIKHILTKKIPVSTCGTCHAGGNRIAPAYTGKMERSARYDRLLQDLEHGHTYSDQVPDIHYEKGLICIDCHTIDEIHGDGNLYVKKIYQMEIRCESCHGTQDAYATGVSAKGNRLPHVKIEKPESVSGGAFKMTLVSKLDNKEHPLPQIRDSNNPKALEAHKVSRHMKNLECYACHSAWVPKCMGCHIKVDQTQQAEPIKVSYDHLKKEQSAFGLYTFIPGTREAESDYVLGVNHRGKVVPFAPRVSVLYTLVDPLGKEVYRMRPQTRGKLLAFAHNPAIPHTVRKETRSCESCHESDKALGLGAAMTKMYPKLSGLMPADFLWDRIVDEEGRPVQETSINRARPLNKEEMRRIREALKKRSKQDEARVRVK
jgi:hypothetical protein